MTTGAAPKSRISIIALIMIGAGLLILGVAALVMLPALKSGAGLDDEITAVPSAVNYPAPQVDLSDLQNNPVSLSNSLGKVVLINQWATWCPPCQREMPTLQAYYEAHQDKDFTIIAIDEGESAGTVAKFVNEYELTFPIWQDPQQVSLEIFGYDGLPSSYVVDRQGNVRLVWFGAINREMLEKHVTPLIEE